MNILEVAGRNKINILEILKNISMLRMYQARDTYMPHTKRAPLIKFTGTFGALWHEETQEVYVSVPIQMTLMKFAYGFLRRISAIPPNPANMLPWPVTTDILTPTVINLKLLDNL